VLYAVTCLAYSNREEGSNRQLQNSALSLTCPVFSKESYLLHINENMAHILICSLCLALCSMRCYIL